jgi:hypothetical protein
MNWDQLKDAVETWAKGHGLPAEMRGKTLMLVEFANEVDCAFFYPQRSLVSQKSFTMALAKLARARHGRTGPVTINPDHYRAWLAAERLEDDVAHREQFIESRYRLLPA